jgi:hypothetical protein
MANLDKSQSLDDVWKVAKELDANIPENIKK